MERKKECGSDVPSTSRSTTKVRDPAKRNMPSLRPKEERAVRGGTMAGLSGYVCVYIRRWGLNGGNVRGGQRRRAIRSDGRPGISPAK